MADVDESFSEKRQRMLQTQIRARGINDARILGAVEKVPRHEFVPKSLKAEAYEDHPLPIGQGQTISQPYIVALMTECLAAHPGQNVLEIGSGCGYQTAVLLELGLKVYAIERLFGLFQLAKETLFALGYADTKRLHLLCTDGSHGWPTPKDVKDAKKYASSLGKKAWNYVPAPKQGFDRILVAAAAPELPQALIDALAEGGRMVLPLGGEHETQRLELYTKKDGKIQNELITLVRFVPLRTA